jgi:hypothetical protein
VLSTPLLSPGKLGRPPPEIKVMPRRCRGDQTRTMTMNPLASAVSRRAQDPARVGVRSLPFSWWGAGPALVFPVWAACATLLLLPLLSGGGAGEATPGGWALLGGSLAGGTLAAQVPALPWGRGAGAPSGSGRLVVEVEAGPAWQSRNEARVPNTSDATRFSLRELLGSGPVPAGRVSVVWTPAERHAFRVLAAPLTLEGTGTPAETLRFAEETFPAGTPVQASYTFNSWRVSWRYRAMESPTRSLWVGATAKLRDAVIELQARPITAPPGGATIVGRTTDLGFVPLLHLAAVQSLGESWDLGLEVDALAGGPGRAVDASATVGVRLADGWSARVGYRTVEGGADVDEVFSFAWLHYATVGVRWTR